MCSLVLRIGSFLACVGGHFFSGLLVVVRLVLVTTPQ